MTATTMVLEAAQVTLGSTNFSDACSSAKLSAEVAEQDISTFASAGWKEVRGGQKSGGLDLELFSDYQASGLDAVMWAAFLAGTPITFSVTPDDAAVSATNPSFSGKILVTKWSVGGKVSEVSTVSVSFPTSGAITMATT